MRVVAYSQFLESYRSVTITSMATSFGVSAAFLDRELSDLISAGRLACKIDKVNGVIESSRPDNRNALYNVIVKQGDLLLSRLQKLARVLDV
jgi:26S proteasome regulatory subunit N7